MPSFIANNLLPIGIAIVLIGGFVLFRMLRKKSAKAEEEEEVKTAHAEASEQAAAETSSQGDGTVKGFFGFIGEHPTFSVSMLFASLLACVFMFWAGSAHDSWRKDMAPEVIANNSKAVTIQIKAQHGGGQVTVTTNGQMEDLLIVHPKCEWVGQPDCPTPFPSATPVTPSPTPANWAGLTATAVMNEAMIQAAKDQADAQKTRSYKATHPDTPTPVPTKTDPPPPPTPTKVLPQVCMRILTYQASITDPTKIIVGTSTISQTTTSEIVTISLQRNMGQQFLLANGDTLDATCTYDNDNGAVLTYKTITADTVSTEKAGQETSAKIVSSFQNGVVIAVIAAISILVIVIIISVARHGGKDLLAIGKLVKIVPNEVLWPTVLFGLIGFALWYAGMKEFLNWIPYLWGGSVLLLIVMTIWEKVKPKSPTPGP